MWLQHRLRQALHTSVTTVNLIRLRAQLLGDHPSDLIVSEVIFSHKGVPFLHKI